MSAPKIITLNSPTIRNQRTLIWLRSQPEMEYWTKWDSVVTSLADYHRWYDLNARIVGMVLTEIQGEEDEWLTDLYEISRDIQMIFLSRSILSLKPQDYWTENYDNIVALDDITEPYPFLRVPWSKTVEDGVALFAFLCRYHRLVDCPVSVERKETFCGAISVVQNIVPQETWLITQFFRSPQKKRFKEIKECLERNTKCSYLDRIVLLNETDLSDLWRNLPGAEKITQIITGKRLTYAHFLQFVHDEVPMNVYTILANADLYMGSSLLDLWKMNLADRVLALLRWDVDDGGTPVLFGPRADSQDTWIMLSNSVKERTWPYATFDFPLGKIGCDNAFAAHLLRNHMSLFNPAMSFQTFHLHTSNVRTYDKKDMIRSDLYVNLVPAYLIDIKQELVPGSAAQFICNELVTFEVRSSTLSNEITFCTMLEKEGRYKWTASEENKMFEPAIPIYRWKNACVTANGLVYDPYTLYKGKHAEDSRFNYWPESKVDLYTPLQMTKKMLAIPFASTDVFQHPDTYVLEYMSRASRLLAEHPDATLWVPKEMVPHVALLSKKFSNCIEWEEGTACWADEVIGFLPGPLSVELGRENVSALRTMMPTWKEKATVCQCTVVIDDIITSNVVKERILPFLKKQNSAWTVRMVSENDHGQYAAILGSTLCLVFGGKNTKNKWAKLWALPVESAVVEFQQELEISGELQHLCHVSDFVSWVLLLSKGSIKDVQDQIMEQFEKWYKKNSYLM